MEQVVKCQHCGGTNIVADCAKCECPVCCVDCCAADMHGANLIGKMVYTGVFVCNEWRRMAKGIVVGYSNNLYSVDVMGLHGGAPWIRTEQYVEHIPA